MSAAKYTTPIQRLGTFLYQLDRVNGNNLWSGHLSPNNGYPEEHAVAAARLFEAAPKLLKACQQALYALKGREHDQFLRDAIAEATGDAS